MAIPAAPGLAADDRFYASLKRLDPATRLEQVCDIEAMERINKDGRGFHPDRAKSDVTMHPRHNGDSMTAPGAAFRSDRQWYRFSFVCRGTPDHMHVLSFDYRIGKLIPESEWEKFGLFR